MRVLLLSQYLNCTYACDAILSLDCVKTHGMDGCVVLYYMGQAGAVTAAPAKSSPWLGKALWTGTCTHALAHASTTAAMLDFEPHNYRHLN